MSIVLVGRAVLARPRAPLARRDARPGFPLRKMATASGGSETAVRFTIWAWSLFDLMRVLVQLKKTGLYNFHVSNGAKMVPFAGYLCLYRTGALGPVCVSVRIGLQSC